MKKRPTTVPADCPALVLAPLSRRGGVLAAPYRRAARPARRTPRSGMARTTGASASANCSPWWLSRIGAPPTNRYSASSERISTRSCLSAPVQPERDPRQRGRQPRGEPQPVGVAPHAAEPGDDRRPGARHRRDVHAVVGVAREVVEVDERGLGQVVEGQVEVPGPGRHHGLRAGRERRVPHGDRLVVGEVALHLLGGEHVGPQRHRQHEVGLLDDLLAVEVEVGHVQQQRVVLGRGVLEVPELVLGEPLRLRVHAEHLVERDRHGLRRVPPAGHLLGVRHPARALPAGAWPRCRRPRAGSAGP